MHNYQQLNLKTKPSKQADQEQNHRYGHHLECYQLEGCRGSMGERCRDYEAQIGRYKIDRENSKNNIGNGEAKEFICIIHGHELRGGIAGGNGNTGQRWAKGEELGQL